MASSGQILDILGKLEKGYGSTQRKEKASRKKEAKQHRALFGKLQSGLERAGHKGKKGQMLGTVLSGALALTGAGMPLVLAMQMAGSLAGGYIGKGKAKSEMDKLTGLTGSKFGVEQETFLEEAGGFGEILARAGMDTALTALTMGTGSAMSKGLTKGLSSAGATLGAKGTGQLSTLLKGIAQNPTYQKTIGGLVSDIGGVGKAILDPIKGDIGKLLSGLQGAGKTGTKASTGGFGEWLSKISEGTIKGLDKETMFSKLAQGKGVDITGLSGDALKEALEKQTSQVDLAKLFGVAKKTGKDFVPSTLGGRGLGTIASAYKQSKQKGLYDYEVPTSLGSPGGYYG